MPFDFSSDLDVGRRPELKSDEKSKGIPTLLEISRCEFLAFHLVVQACPKSRLSDGGEWGRNPAGKTV
jgi:hypothetical protein